MNLIFWKCVTFVFVPAHPYWRKQLGHVFVTTWEEFPNMGTFPREVCKMLDKGLVYRRKLNLAVNDE